MFWFYWYCKLSFFLCPEEHVDVACEEEVNCCKDEDTKGEDVLSFSEAILVVKMRAEHWSNCFAYSVCDDKYA